MLDDVRRDKILTYLKTNVSATVKELASALYVSDATIRRDLTEMQNLGLLKRSHGGAVLLEPADEISIFVRMTKNVKEKELAATNALRHIPVDFKTVFLDCSSTILALGQRMNLSDKTVMVNNLQTAMQLSKVRGINLLIPGGNIMSTGVSVTGSWTNTLISEFRFDLMLASCAAIDTQNAYETSIDQRETKRTAFERSAYRILIVDHTKFPKHETYVFEKLSAFDLIVFDSLTEADRAALQGLPVVCS